jgi:hypothetical protein
MSVVGDEAVDALRDLASGRVHRSRHDLVVDGRDLTGEFQRVLGECGYTSARIRDLSVPRGVRFPAFVITGTRADFGHVFQEKFHENEHRTLFGSVVRDWRGDWELMLTRRDSRTVWVKLDAGAPFDEDRPSGGV